MRGIKHRVMNKLFPLKETAPARAYDLWDKQYDAQPDNLMLALDEALFSSLLKDVSLKDKTVADVGCGTGRHWKKIYEKQPAEFIGYDVSQGMLDVLKQKFPTAKTFLLHHDKLQGLEKETCDVLITTLAMAHIEAIENAFAEWNGVLKRGAQVLITDYHPDMLAKGGNRTFTENGKKVAVKNYVHSLDKIRRIVQKLGWEEEGFEERKIDEEVKHFYEKQNALKIYETFKGTPIIYGMRLRV